MARPRLLLVDNYDSFTHNLAHWLTEAGAAWPVVLPNDTPLTDLPLDDVDGVVISPGPGRPDVPRDFGVCGQIIERYDGPILGVCLGHQGIGAAFGARIGPAPRVMHGRQSTLERVIDDPLLRAVPSGARVVRYHSLMVDALPPELRGLAWADDGVLMALRHRKRPIWGVQFHPESICTEHGRTLLRNFVELVATRPSADQRSDRAQPSTTEPPTRPATHRLTVEPLTTCPDPEAAFARLFAGRTGAFWLDSAPGEGRYHYLGIGEIRRFRIGEHDTFAEIDAELSAVRLEPAPHPFPFVGGLVGYLGYELKADCGGGIGPRSRHPDAALIRAHRMVVIDRLEERAWLATVDPLDAPEANAAWHIDMGHRLAGLEPLTPVEPPARQPRLRLDRTPERYLDDIDACLEALRQGESYEVCLTTHLISDHPVDPLVFHRRLRRDNPAPYAALLDLGDFAVVSASPERFLRITADGEVEARPIKGTRARAAHPAADAAAREDLRTAEKDRAENLMITDLLRNDLGRVCQPGSVHVPALMQVESFATVHQLVSTVRGTLRARAGAVDCVRAAFPGGSMTGAPKLRTMEIIERLEGTARGIYSGALGWFGYDGAADLSIVIRTAVIDETGCSIGIGGAIVALSDPMAELREALLKGQALADALGAPMPDLPADRDRPRELAEHHPSELTCDAGEEDARHEQDGEAAPKEHGRRGA